MEIYETPLGNTGSVLPDTPPMEPQFHASIDWLQGCFYLRDNTDIHYLQTLFAHVFKDEWILDQDRPIYKGRHFAHSLRTIRGTVFAWNNTDEGIDCWLSATGSSLAGGSFKQLREFLLYLVAKQTRFTRIDVAVDDFAKSLKPTYFKNAYKHGHHKGFRKMSFIENFDNSEDDQGFTVYMGRRNGNKLTRFYNKSAESNGEIDSYRLEVEYKDDYTKNVIDYLLCHDDFASAIANLVVSAVDFRDDDDIQLYWWNSFIARLEAHSVHLSCDRVKPSLENSMSWIEHQVETTLATVKEFCDRITVSFDDWIKERLDSGRARMRGIHQAMLKEAVKVCSVSALPPPILPDYGELF